MSRLPLLRAVASQGYPLKLLTGAPVRRTCKKKHFRNTKRPNDGWGFEIGLCFRGPETSQR